MRFEAIGTGCCFLEAPRADGDALWFSDPVLGGLRRLWPDGRIDEFMPERLRIGGVAINQDGAIIFSGTGGLGWLNPATEESGILLDTIGGKPIPAVNDIFPADNGGLYFGTSDPSSGQPAPTSALYRLDPDGRVQLLQDGLQVPNGIGLSPDGRRLYVNESWLGSFAYDVAADGTLSGRSLLSPAADCDGLAVDQEGGIWIARFNSGSLLRVLPDGRLDREIAVSVKAVTSLCFGGGDDRTVYVTTGGDNGLDLLLRGLTPPKTAALYRGYSDIPGAPVPRTRFVLPRPAVTASR
jgi:sugar lactone lactonase YvrE